MTITQYHLSCIDAAKFANNGVEVIRNYQIVPTYWNKVCIFSIKADIPSKSNYYKVQQLWLRYYISGSPYTDYFTMLWESSHIDLMGWAKPDIKRVNKSFIDACTHYGVEYFQTCENCLFKYDCCHSFNEKGSV